MGKIRTWQSTAQLAAFLLVFAMALSNASTPAQARTWKPSLEVQTREYLEILDERDGNFIMVWWLASPMVPHSPSAAALFDKYVVIMALHAKLSANGSVSYTHIESLDVQDGDRRALAPVGEDKVPPTLTGVLSTMGAVLKQVLGAMGQHVQYFVFESGGINACRHGRLFVNYNGESYSYDTPIPGC